jgi:hypothetical protein
VFLKIGLDVTAKRQLPASPGSRNTCPYAVTTDWSEHLASYVFQRSLKPAEITTVQRKKKTSAANLSKL